MVFWNSGAIAAMIWLIVFFPMFVFAMIWFWLRREIQPIKARSPRLVLWSDILILGYAVLMCAQRIMGDSYPCLLNMWSGFAGTLLLLNTYVWRCWVLYFTFNLTQQRILNKSVDKLPFFIRNRHYSSSPFLLKFLGSCTVALLLPCAILTSEYPSIRQAMGDRMCTWHDGKLLLALYGLLYFVVFCRFALSIRQIVDGFSIRQELKITGLLGLFAVPSWLLFNNVPTLKEINEEVFPVSTFCVIIAVTGVLCTSTVWPLYASLKGSDPTTDLDIPENLSDLRSILSHDQGRDAFEQFLSKEFCVENLQFYMAVEDYRQFLMKNQDKRDKAAELSERAVSIYEKYILIDAPFQVNLPAAIFQDLQQTIKMRFLTGRRRTVTQTVPRKSLSSNSKKIQNSLLEKKEVKTDTVFDAAQGEIYKLMERDSVPRFINSDTYRKLVMRWNDSKRKKEIMADEGIV
mmetsp:Transcript_35082/g.68882  ORF Transcript_35082/g.68882 Transcript_35082/m.68882 type:complete len:460 (+) Transcript_35082:48-1427(+)